jgi:23S rRNA pseudouridine1911/1915/1917 synthase
MDNPYILEETESFAVVFKPARMHSTNSSEKIAANNGQFTVNNENAQGTKKNLLEWYRERLRNAEEVHLMHRLDFETHGLVLFAKTKKSFNFFKDLQNKGGFVKEYSAVCVPAKDSVPAAGFPRENYCEYGVPQLLTAFDRNKASNNFTIESYFRPYGPGRKQVRPVIEDGKKHKETAKDKGGFYRTEIININGNIFKVRIERGFRHQIRCHLCWIGFPILNDPLYKRIAGEGIISSTGETALGTLALRAHALIFTDPASGKLKECGIPPFES